jgi:hypothetical protein
MIHFHFIPLASHDDYCDFSFCRHGVVHLMWWNVTVRLEAGEFQHLASLLERGTTLASSIPLGDGDFAVTLEEERYRVRMGPVEFVLTADEYLAMTDTALEAARQLERVLASDEWHDWEPEPDLLGYSDGWQMSGFSLN